MTRRIVGAERQVPRRNLTPEQAAARLELVRNNRAAGIDDSETAAMIGIKRDTLREWMVMREGRQQPGEGRQGHTQRRCMRDTCRNFFWSSGPGNRHCPKCREAMSNADHYMCLGVGGSPGRQLQAKRS